MTEVDKSELKHLAKAKKVLTHTPKPPQRNHVPTLDLSVSTVENQQPSRNRPSSSSSHKRPHQQGEEEGYGQDSQAKALQPPSRLSTAPPISSSAANPKLGRFKSPSKTKLQNHIRNINRLQIPLPPALAPYDNRAPPPSSSTPSTGSVSARMMNLLTSGLQSRPTPPSSYTNTFQTRGAEDIDVVQEIDNDIATALVSLGGSVLGLEAEQLSKSPGMRKLVARNINWVHGAHDALKFIGLMAAKKLNQIVKRRRDEDPDREWTEITSLPPPNPSSVDEIVPPVTQPPPPAPIAITPTPPPKKPRRNASAFDKFPPPPLASLSDQTVPSSFTSSSFHFPMEDTAQEDLSKGNHASDPIVIE